MKKIVYFILDAGDSFFNLFFEVDFMYKIWDKTFYAIRCWMAEKE